MEENLGLKKRRKPRSDRNHLIYMLTCKPTGEQYVGLTVVRGQAYKKSMDTRWHGHIHHATVENRGCLIHRAIRQHGPEAFDREILKVVRGKLAAHKEETQEIRVRMPALNMESMGRKKNSIQI